MGNTISKKKSVKKASVKKASVKKAVSKKAVIKKAVSKKATAKKAVPQKAIAKKSVSKKAATKMKAIKSMSYQERYQKIAEAAYLLAEKQKFSPNNELRNWLQAEIQIDNWIESEKIKLKK